VKLKENINICFYTIYLSILLLLITFPLLSRSDSPTPKQKQTGRYLSILADITKRFPMRFNVTFRSHTKEKIKKCCNGRFLTARRRARASWA